MTIIQSFSKLTPMFIFVGFEICVFSMASLDASFVENNKDDILGCLISGYVAYLLAFVLSSGFYMGGFEKNKIGNISTILLALAAGVLIIAGMAVHADRYGNHRAYAYENTLLGSSALMALLASVCGIIYVIKD